jgi:RHS repeat-associated protein
MAKVNPFGFSTQYTDSETDLVYYGYRYYSPALGRWLSRDPIEEQGGLNLYAFGSNNPNSGFDVLGSFWRFIIPSYGVGDMYSPPLPGGVILVPGNPASGGNRDRIEDSILAAARALAKKEEKYTVYEVESNKDANEKLNKVRNCMCIEELNIIGHGKIGSINLVSINDSMREQDGYGSLTAKRVSGQWKIFGLEVFDNVKFCTPCKIYLRGCNVGEGESGRELLNAIATKTSCEVYAWKGTVSELGRYGGLPAGGFFWFFSAPDFKSDIKTNINYAF